MFGEGSGFVRDNDMDILKPALNRIEALARDSGGTDARARAYQSRLTGRDIENSTAGHPNAAGKQGQRQRIQGVITPMDTVGELTRLVVQIAIGAFWPAVFPADDSQYASRSVGRRWPRAADAFWLNHDSECASSHSA